MAGFEPLHGGITICPPGLISLRFFPNCEEKHPCWIKALLPASQLNTEAPCESCRTSWSHRRSWHAHVRDRLSRTRPCAHLRRALGYVGRWLQSFMPGTLGLTWLGALAVLQVGTSRVIAAAA